MAGVYVGVKVSSKSTKKIQEFMKENKIPNPLDSSKFHCTIIYSRVGADIKSQGYDFVALGVPTGLEIWKTKSGENALVMKLKCPDLVNRHKELMKKHDKLTYDYDEYKPHLTLSYDVGDWKIPDEMDPMNIGVITLINEYTEELKESWAKAA